MHTHDANTRAHAHTHTHTHTHTSRPWGLLAILLAVYVHNQWCRNALQYSGCNVFSYYRTCSLTTERVILLQNVFSHLTNGAATLSSTPVTTCSLTTERVPLLQNVFSHLTNGATTLSVLRFVYIYDSV